MNRALHKMTDEERADEEAFIANVMRAIREEEALDMDEQDHIEDMRLTSWWPVLIVLLASAATSMAIAAWLVGVVL